jgi:RNA polymerase sigma-70 factor (ECF subfamily)
MSAIPAIARERSAIVRSTEGELKSMMLAALSGDGKAYASLLKQVTRLLRSFFARRMQDDARDIEDLVQEALIAVHTRRGSFDRERAFTPWLYSIARHKLVDHFRHSRRHQPIDDLEGILVTEGFEQSSNAAMDLNRLLDGLPDKQARAIRDTKILGLSVAEVAQRVGISVSDVKVSVHRGMKTLAGCASTGHC